VLLPQLLASLLQFRQFTLQLCVFCIHPLQCGRVFFSHCVFRIVVDHVRVDEYDS
jgi:hypothetical protein